MNWSVLLRFSLVAVGITGDYWAFSLSTSSRPRTTGPYCVNVKCAVQPSRRDDFIASIQSNQRLTLENQPKALQYVVGEDVDTPNTFYIHKQFTDTAGFVEHREMPHNAAWQEFESSDPFVEGPVTNFYYGMHRISAQKVPILQDATYCLNVQLCIDENVRDEFLEVIENNARGSNQEESLCLQYVWGEDESERNTFHFHEEYTGKMEEGKGLTHTLQPSTLQGGKYSLPKIPSQNHQMSVSTGHFQSKLNEQTERRELFLFIF